MPGMIQELQTAAADPSVPVGELLRRALIASRKLGLKEFEQWALQEMDGYPRPAEVPEYRVVVGWVVGRSPTGSWMPVQFEDPAEAEFLSRMPMTQPVAELEAVTAGSTPRGTVMISYGGSIERRMLEHVPMMTGLALQVPATRVRAILDTIRNSVLKWALQLESEGIKGEGFSFSEGERAAAQTAAPSVNYTFHNVGTAQIQQDSPGAIQVAGDLALNDGALDQALALLREVQAALPEEEASELRAELDTIEVQRKSPKPKWRIIKETLQSARRIAESAAGRLAGTAIAERMGQFDWTALLQ